MDPVIISLEKHTFLSEPIALGQTLRFENAPIVGDMELRASVTCGLLVASGAPSLLYAHVLYPLPAETEFEIINRDPQRAGTVEYRWIPPPNDSPDPDA